jgi:hypothetical protein
MRVGRARPGRPQPAHACPVCESARRLWEAPQDGFASPADAEVGVSLVRLARPRPGAAGPRPPGYVAGGQQSRSSQECASPPPNARPVRRVRFTARRSAGLSRFNRSREERGSTDQCRTGKQCR